MRPAPHDGGSEGLNSRLSSQISNEREAANPLECLQSVTGGSAVYMTSQEYRVESSEELSPDIRANLASVHLMDNCTVPQFVLHRSQAAEEEEKEELPRVKSVKEGEQYMRISVCFMDE